MAGIIPNDESVQAITCCRSCGHPASSMVTLLDLGASPLANRLISAEDLDAPEPRFPLVLVYCPSCALLQITHTVHPDVLFREYVYFSSVSSTLLEHSRHHVEDLITRRKLGPNHLVIEAASNDGYLLQYFQQAGIRCMGVEPARNIAAVANAKGISTLNEFFTRELAEKLAAQGTLADLFIAKNVLAHASNLNDFVAAIRAILKPDGIAEIEAPYARDMIDHCEFDTIYHEHLCYFTLASLEPLFARHDLVVADVRRLPIHGGSLRLTVAPANGPNATPSPAVIALREQEHVWGAQRLATYQGFSLRVLNLKNDLVGLLQDLKQQGKRIAAYGASAKGTTLLNSFGIGAETLEFVADRATAKQGMFTPATHIKIVHPDCLPDLQPDYVLLLTWNFSREILEQQKTYRLRGGKFIVPIPDVQVL